MSDTPLPPSSDEDGEDDEVADEDGEDDEVADEEEGRGRCEGEAVNDGNFTVGVGAVADDSGGKSAAFDPVADERNLAAKPPASAVPASRSGTATTSAPSSAAAFARFARFGDVVLGETKVDGSSRAYANGHTAEASVPGARAPGRIEDLAKQVTLLNVVLTRRECSSVSPHMRVYKLRVRTCMLRSAAS
jgi:hypothetical protein